METELPSENFFSGSLVVGSRYYVTLSEKRPPFPELCQMLRWPESRGSHRGIASESYRCDSNH